MKPTIQQIKKAIAEDNDMVANHQGAVYFLGNEPRKNRIKKNLASDIYFAFCHSRNCYGYQDVIKLLKCKAIPYDIVEFYVMTGNGGGEELEIIEINYGVSASFSKEELEAIKDFDKILSSHRENESSFTSCSIKLQDSDKNIN